MLHAGGSFFNRHRAPSAHVPKLGMAQVQTPLVVDNNCFFRLLDGPRPLLGRVLGGFRLVTTTELLAEATKSKPLAEKYPALNDPAARKELDAACLKFAPKQLKVIRDSTEELRQGGQDLITQHCARQNIALRRLSYIDTAAWAVAQYMKGALATDEWPLRFAASAIGDDEGNTVPLFSSMGLLHLLEKDAQLAPEERWNIVRQWRIEDERLHRDADKEYWELFGEAPPNAQSKRK
jgi:hypothetical protein